MLALKPDNLMPCTDPSGEERKDPAVEELEKKLAAEGLSTMWKTGKLLLGSRVRKVAEAVIKRPPSPGEDGLTVIH